MARLCAYILLSTAIMISELDNIGPVNAAVQTDQLGRSDRPLDKQKNPLNAQAPANLLILTRKDYLELENEARQAGEDEIADHFASRANGIHERGWLGIGKKAATWFLRHSASKLPEKIRPYAGKFANFLEATEAWEIAGIATGLMRQGVPPEVAWEAAKWIVLAFG